MALNVLMIGAGDKVPTFIARRIEAYRKEGINLILQRFNNSANDDHKILIEGKLRKRNFFFLKIVVADLFRCISGIIKIYRFSPYNHVLKSLVWAIDHYQYAHILPDIIHLQWIGSAKNYEWLKNFYNVPLISSARGRQVTAYPYQRNSYKKIIQDAFEASDKVHCVSEDIKKACIGLGCNKEKLFINYNGINTDIFAPSKEKNNKITELVSIGYMVWNKCFPYQLLILQLLSRKYSFKHTIIGEGKDIEVLKYLSYQLGIADSIEFKGHLSEQQTIKCLQTADVYLSTSMAEGLSNSVMEAASCGLPVVAFNCEGMNEIIIDNNTGYIISRGDVNLFAEKVGSLIKDKQQRLTMGNAARKHMESQFKAEVHVKKMIEYYYSTSKVKQEIDFL